MKDNHHPIVGVVAIVAFFAFLSILVLSNAGYFRHNPSTISVTASGSAYAVPDQVVLVLSLNGTGQTPAAATANLSIYANQLNQTLQSFVAGNQSNLQTTYYSLSRIRNSTYYVAIEGIEATIPAAQVTGALSQVSQLQNVQITSVTSEFAPAQRAALMNQALSAALSNATKQAEILADGATLQVGNLSTYNYPVYPAFAGAAVNSGSAPVFYNSQSGVVEQVTATFYRN